MLEGLFNKLGYNKENGLYILSESEQDVLEIFPSRFSRILIDVIKPYAIFSLEIPNKYDEHLTPFNNPLILFYDNPSDQERGLILKHSFNLGRSHVVIINNSNNIEILNGFNFSNSEPQWLESIDKDRDLLSIHNLRSGRGWKEIYQRYFEKEETVDRLLLRNLTDARRILISKEKDFPEGNLTPEIANRLIGRLIFIRYLIDRNVAFNDQLQGDTKEKRQNSLNELLLDHDRTYEFFEYISEKFKGDLFPLKFENKGVPSFERDLVKVENLKVLHHLFTCSNMFVGKMVRGYKVQRSLFNLYDFEIIPVELISNIYESFLGNTIYSKEKTNIVLSKQKEVKAYYTPSLLVDYVISQTVKPFLRENIKLQCRVLDPSCGSGIFLVESLRQIINREIKTKSSYNRNGTELISNNRLWELLQENIFGIDIDQNAIEIAIFSLYITLLDYKTKPCKIENFEFKDLKDKNLFGGDDADFFNESNVFNNLFKNEINLDFIIGNPPWGTVPKSSYVEYIKKRSAKEKENNTSSVALKISNKEISQAFMVRVGDLIQDEASTKICFIITGKNLYNSNNNARQWRRYLLTNFNIHQCFDLFGVNNGIAGGKQLFENTRQPPAILIYSKKNAKSKKGDNFKHITARANLYYYYYYFKTIVIEKNDVKVVNQNLLLNDDKLWKLLMYGNSLDYMFIKRLRNRGKKISSIMQDHNLESKGGFKSRESIISQDKRKDTKHLWHYDYVEVRGVKGLRQYQVIFNKTFKDKLEDLSRSGKINDDFNVAQLPDLKVFEGTKLLLKKGLKISSGYSPRSVSAVTTRNCVFSSTIASITSLNSQTSNEQEDILYMMSAIFNSKLFAYYLLMTSSSFGAGRNRVNFVEFLNMPLVLDKKLGILSRNLHKLLREEKPLNFNKSEISELKDKIESRIQKIYEVSDVEEELINYALNVSIPIMKRADRNWSKRPRIFHPIDKKNPVILKNFANIFVDHFSKRFNNEDRQFIVDVYLNNDFVALHFIISEKRKKTVEFYREAKLEEAVKKIGSLGINEVSRDLFIQQDVRGFNENSFYLIKPNIAKNWHLALAHKDLLEFIEAIARSEMTHAKVAVN